MSSRNFRKLKAQCKGALAPEESDEEYQPAYMQRAGVSQYAGLEISSTSGSEHAVSDRSEEDAKNFTVITKQKKKNKKKGKAKGRILTNEVDEVERSVQEVNAILGEPEKLVIPDEPPNEALVVLSLEAKHLNVTHEFRRLFGPEEGENRRARTAPNRALLLKRVIVHPNKETKMFQLNNTGWSMIKYKDVKKRMYFVFCHSDAYQKMHNAFVQRHVNGYGSSDIWVDMEIAKKNMHVEMLLELADRFFRLEEDSIGNEIVENVVTFLQYVAHPLFILSQNNIRLDYKFRENRPFHVVMLKYMYLLSNKACHRTALEICKMMLLLDPNDPLALLSVLDIFALRAREHEWLIAAIKYFDRQREACLLYNIKYSNALAHFHVATKKNLNFKESDDLIREALLAHPPVFRRILSFCRVTKPELLNHAIFRPDPEYRWSHDVNEHYMIYARMTYPRWNEPAVMTWLLRNATELCAEFETSASIQESAMTWGIHRRTLFQVRPQEYVRHMSVLRNMGKLILDTSLSSMSVPTCGWDPLYEKAVNRYGYSYLKQSVLNTNADRSAMYSDVMHPYLEQLNRYATAMPGMIYMDLIEEEVINLDQIPEAYRRSSYPSFNFRWTDDFRAAIIQNEGDLRFFAESWGKRSLTSGYADCRPCHNLPAEIWMPYPANLPFNFHVGYFPPPSKDLYFNDEDPAFTSYDYDDDAENFAQYERDMARALSPTIYECEDEESSSGFTSSDSKENGEQVLLNSGFVFC